MKQEIQDYTSDELSLIVYNDESLYRIRSHWNVLKDEIDLLYVYTESQLETLKNAIEEEFMDMGSE